MKITRFWLTNEFEALVFFIYLKALEIQKFGLRPVGLTEGTGIVRGKEEQFIPQDFMEIDEYLKQGHLEWFSMPFPCMWKWFY